MYVYGGILIYIWRNQNTNKWSPTGLEMRSTQLNKGVWWHTPHWSRPNVMPTCAPVCSVVSSSFWPYGLQPARLLCPWDLPGKNPGVGCHFLLQGSSWPRDWTRVFCTAGRFFTTEPFEMRPVQNEMLSKCQKQISDFEDVVCLWIEEKNRKITYWYSLYLACVGQQYFGYNRLNKVYCES